jgi:transcriptional regulator with XRE-family HTH domain
MLSVYGMMQNQDKGVLAVGSRTLGQYLRARREMLGLTQEDVLAFLVQRGLKKYTHTSLIHWEKDRAMPPIYDPKFVRAIAEILGATDKEILRAAGFALDEDAPDELPPEIRRLLERATPDELDKVIAMMQLLIADKGDQA